MSLNTRNLVVNNIKLSTDASFQEAFSVAEARLKKASIKVKDPVYSIYRRSIDARKKDDIKFVYSVLVRAELENVTEKTLALAGASEDKSEMPEVKFGSEPLSERPVIIGSGPCGLFCALMLAENGYRPIVLERGGCVAERIKEIEAFKKIGRAHV